LGWIHFVVFFQVKHTMEFRPQKWIVAWNG
jgi:hypothetical protein